MRRTTRAQPMPPELVAVRLIVQGRVQGVGFRDAMCAEALRLGVTGWVRNRRDGSVEAVVCGTGERVDRMRAWARRGPPAAQVTRVTEAPCAAEGNSFERRPTA